jgi:hypothetical protein
MADAQNSEVEANWCQLLQGPKIMYGNRSSKKYKASVQVILLLKVKQQSGGHVKFSFSLQFTVITNELLELGIWKFICRHKQHMSITNMVMV